MKESGFSGVQPCKGDEAAPLGALQHPSPLSQKLFPGLFQDSHFQKLLMLCLAFPFLSSQLLWSFCCCAYRCKKTEAKELLLFGAWKYFHFGWCGVVLWGKLLLFPHLIPLRRCPSCNKGSIHTGCIQIHSQVKPQAPGWLWNVQHSPVVSVSHHLPALHSASYRIC